MATPESSKTSQDEESLRSELMTAMQSLKRREPLEPTYKDLLKWGAVATKNPVLPKDKFYKKIGSNLRTRVETFMEQTQGKNPLDRIETRQPLQEEQMRAALTLREAKKHEQKALLELTLSALPRRNGMDATTRKRHLEGIALGLQSHERKPPVRPRIQTVEQARMQAEHDQQIAVAKAREDARKAREVEEKRASSIVKQKVVETPQQRLHRFYINPVFKKLWDMEFPQLGNTNPFRMIIDKDNCAAYGAPDYCDIVKKPMNLTYIQRKIEAIEYATLQEFFQDVDLLISNAILYNSETGNPFKIAAEEMRRRYRKMAKKVVQAIQKAKKHLIK